MDSAARNAGVAIPHSEETRREIRLLLRTFHKLDHPDFAEEPSNHRDYIPQEALTGFPAGNQLPAALADLGIPILVWPTTRA